MLVAGFYAAATGQEANSPGRRFGRAIEDNSFFLEEAYN
jgi:hypothetical protein